MSPDAANGQIADDWHNWLISVDDHVIEPPHVWQARVPMKLRNDAPRWIRDEEGEAWVFEGRRIPIMGLNSVVGRPREEWSPAPLTLDSIRPGSYDPAARIDDMNLDGVLAQLVFPTFPRFCGQEFFEADNRELGLACVRAYNDWMIEEWAGSAPGRFIPLILIPLWDPSAAATEIRRCADTGGKAIAFSENPAKLGLPSIHDQDRYWDPVFVAAQETNMPLCTHIGSSSSLPRTSDDAPAILSITLAGLNAQATLVDWFYSGNLLRFPELKLVLSEGGISFLPGTIDRVARDLERQGPWARSATFGGDVGAGTSVVRLAEGHGADIDIYDFDPMAVFLRQVGGCMIPDYEGWEVLDQIGTSNVMLETDYPHSDSSWPTSIAQVKKHLGHLPETARYDIHIGNACRIFNFEPAQPPTPNIGGASRGLGAEHGS